MTNYGYANNKIIQFKKPFNQQQDLCIAEKLMDLINYKDNYLGLSFNCFSFK